MILTLIIVPAYNIREGFTSLFKYLNQSQQTETDKVTFHAKGQGTANKKHLKPVYVH